MTPLKRGQIISSTILGISYISIFLLRKPLGVVKTDLQTTYKLTKNQLGWMDTSFLLPYALTQIMFGNFADKYGPRLTITFNLIVSSLSMISFGFWDSPYIFSVLLFVNGAAQATIWPNCVKCLSEWFSSEQHATVFGIMGSVLFSGGIMGTALAVYLQQIYSPDLRMVFMIPSIICLFVAAIVNLFLKTPEEANIIDDGTPSNLDVPEKAKGNKLNFLQVWRISLVPELSFTMFGIKLVRYCLYMWLPMYLYQNLKYEKATAGYLSTAFEIGCVFGSTGLGYLIDRFLGGRVHWGVCVSIIGSAVSLLLFQITSFYGFFSNFACLFMAGALQAGPDVIVTGALAAEVGKRENAQSAVCGIVNGFGSIGTIAQGPLIALIVTKFGWSGSFYAMIGLTLLGALAAGKVAILHGRSQSHTSNNNVFIT